MHFSQFPFLRYLPFLLLGLLFPTISELLVYPIGFLILGCAWLLYFILQIRSSKRVKRNSVLAYICLFLLGLGLSGLIEEEQKELLDSPIIQADAYLAAIQDYDVQKPNSKQNLVRVHKASVENSWLELDQEVLIYHKSEVPMQPGDLILIKGSPDLIPETTGPGQFDYKKYLLRKGIGHRHFINSDFVLIGKSGVYSLEFRLKRFRKFLSSKIDSTFSDPQSASVAKALLLGQKDNLDPDLKEAYSGLGVMHVLAVSGLHVGIIYAIFLFISRRFMIKGKPKLVFFSLVILLLWLYACLTGLSPSVVRACTMFSLLILGQLKDRDSGIFNILAFSAILMIAVNPNVIYEVGFQLSYLAVAGIVLLQPLILRLWMPKYRVLEYFWQIVAVSIAAQLATFPLTVFYFHSFPSLFLIGNLLIIPLTFAIMQFGIPWLILSFVPWLGDGLGWILNQLIFIQNWLIQFLTSFSFLTLDRLTISFYSMALVWVVLLLWSAWDEIQKRKIIRVGLASLVLWLGFSSFSMLKTPNQEIIFYPSEEGFLIDSYDNGSLKSFSHQFNVEQIGYGIDPYRLQKRKELIPNPMLVYQLNDHEFLLSLIQVKIDLETKVIDLGELDDPQVYEWIQGEWEPIESKDCVGYEGQAIRIIP